MNNARLTIECSFYNAKPEEARKDKIEENFQEIYSHILALPEGSTKGYCKAKVASFVMP